MAKKDASDEDDDPFHPRRNPDLLGHERAEAKVVGAWSSKRFPHAWLITGPRGIGKATFAYRMARWVLVGGNSDQNGSAESLFGDEVPTATLYVSPENGTFRRIAANGHADFRAVAKPDDKTQIPVEKVRSAVQFVHQTAAEGGWKAIVIDCADDLNPSGANAILKVLEEPPPRTVFLLVSHAPGGLLPTIRSRCRTLSLKPLGREAMADLLPRHTDQVSAADFETLYRLSEGSIGRALDYAEAGGIDLYRAAMTLLSDPARPDPKQLYGLADMLSPKTAEAAYRAFTHLMDWWMKRAIRAQASGTRPDAIVPEEEHAFDAWSGIGSLETSMRLWEKLTGLFAQAEPPANLDRRQLVVSAFLELRKAAAR